MTDKNTIMGNEDVDEMMRFIDGVIAEFESGKNDNYIARLERYQLEQSENERNHDGVIMERRLIEYVRTGNIEAMKEMTGINGEIANIDTIGRVSGTYKKSFEYYVVTGIVIATRAAVDAGVSVEQAYELSDIFLQELSEAKTLREYMRIAVLSNLTFTRLVADLKLNRRYPFINSCKEYIDKNLRKPIKIKDIGPQIGVNNSYLSKTFSESEGMTIKQYLIKERCSHAANLLKYSNYRLSEIAEYFCFSSHSHFGTQFKKIYGMTPNEYRLMYKSGGSWGIKD